MADSKEVEIKRSTGDSGKIWYEKWSTSQREILA